MVVFVIILFSLVWFLFSFQTSDSMFSLCLMTGYSDVQFCDFFEQQLTLAPDMHMGSRNIRNYCNEMLRKLQDVYVLCSWLALWISTS